MRHFNYYAAAPQKFKELYALKFDGVNDYLQSANTFVQWTSLQPFTLSVFLKDLVFNSLRFTTLLDTRTAGLINNGILFRCDGIGSKINFLLIGSGLLTRRIWIDISFQNFNQITITYDGLSDATGCKAYLDNVEKPTSIFDNDLDQTIAQVKPIRIFSDFLDVTRTPQAVLKEVSVSNFVKSTAELTADFNAGMDLTANPLSPSYDPTKQLLHVAPIYKTYIKTLDSTQPFQAFQGGSPINMSLFGYPNPLVLDTNLIKI